MHENDRGGETGRVTSESRYVTSHVEQVLIQHVTNASIHSQGNGKNYMTKTFMA